MIKTIKEMEFFFFFIILECKLVFKVEVCIPYKVDLKSYKNGGRTLIKITKKITHNIMTMYIPPVLCAILA